MILVAFALPFEGALLEKMIAKRLGSFRADLRVIYLGMGPDAARASMTKALESHSETRAVICAGFAGALQPKWRPGDVAIASNRTDPALLESIASMNRTIGVPLAELLSVAAPVSTAEAKARLGQESGADLVDMETAAACGVCIEHRIPVLALRAVSDDIRTDLPLPPDLMPAGTPPNALSLLFFLLHDPRRIPGFIRFVVGCFGARRSLTRALAKIIPILANRRL